MTAPTHDVAFLECGADRLVIRRFRAEGARPSPPIGPTTRSTATRAGTTPFSHEQARSFIESLETAHPDTPREWFQFAVVEAATGIHIGELAARADAHNPRLATIGVTMATSAQGQGYAGEVVAWLLDYLLLDRRKHRVTAECDVRNSGAVALLDHLRVRREAHHLQSAWWKGEWVDEYVYALLAQEWLERRSPD